MENIDTNKAHEDSGHGDKNETTDGGGNDFFSSVDFVGRSS